MEKSKLTGGGGRGGRAWTDPDIVVGGGGGGGGGGNGKVPPANIFANWSAPMPAMSLEKEGGGGKSIMFEGFLVPPMKLSFVVVPGMVNPGIPGSIGCLAGIFWSISPSASSSISCSSSSRIIFLPPRRSQVP